MFIAYDTGIEHRPGARSGKVSYELIINWCHFVFWWRKERKRLNRYQNELRETIDNCRPPAFALPILIIFPPLCGQTDLGLKRLERVFETTNLPFSFFLCSGGTKPTTRLSTNQTELRSLRPGTQIIESHLISDPIKTKQWFILELPQSNWIAFVFITTLEEKLCHRNNQLSAHQSVITKHRAVVKAPKDFRRKLWPTLRILTSLVRIGPQSGTI